MQSSKIKVRPLFFSPFWIKGFAFRDEKREITFSPAIDTPGQAAWGG